MYNCTNCHKIFNNLEEYNKHINQKDNCILIQQTYKCNCCDKIYTIYK